MTIRKGSSYKDRPPHEITEVTKQFERELDAEIDSMQEMYSAIASLARSQPDKPLIVIAMEHIADLKQLVRDLYDVAARGGFDVGEESKFSERMANLDELRGEA